jgi:hypothetical protein
MGWFSRKRRRGADSAEAGRRRVIAGLLAGTVVVEDEDAEEARMRERGLARAAWAMERVDALKRAQRAMIAAWMELIAPYEDVDDEDLPEIDPPPEEAVVDAILAEINAAVDHDRWPAHLHWSL